MVVDTVGDLIVRLKNGGIVKKSAVSVPYSNYKHQITKKLAEKGYVRKVEVVGDMPKKEIKVILSYQDGKHKITGAKRISRPSNRMYVSVRNINKFRSKNGIVLLSTPKGILTDAEAVREKVGGEILCKIW